MQVETCRFRLKTRLHHRHEDSDSFLEMIFLQPQTLPIFRAWDRHWFRVPQWLGYWAPCRLLHLFIRLGAGILNQVSLWWLEGSIFVARCDHNVSFGVVNCFLFEDVENRMSFGDCDGFSVGAGRCSFPYWVVSEQRGRSRLYFIIYRVPRGKGKERGCDTLYAVLIG